MCGKFEKVSTKIGNEKWEKSIERLEPLYKTDNDLRSEFERDYTKVIYSNGYRRLKHKTQVFFSPSNDHICTRLEHSIYVGAIGYTIGKNLGLNLELINAIASAHDIGHSPFGHAGEKILNEISIREIGETFWHEKNGLDFVDNIETLEDNNGYKKNLNLTYAVRDGIISHCGEVDENRLRPRENAIDLKEYKKPNEYPPYTWEGCIIKIADKISYIGRDIEDAIELQILKEEDLKELDEMFAKKFDKTINNTNIIQTLITDLCNSSNVEEGLKFSNEKVKMINEIKAFNYKKIYLNDKVLSANDYFKIIINQIYNKLSTIYTENFKLKNLEKLGKDSKIYLDFYNWLKAYCNIENRIENKFKNNIIYNLNVEKEYKKAVIDYISGMTDNYAINTFQRIISF